LGGPLYFPFGYLPFMEDNLSLSSSRQYSIFFKIMLYFYHHYILQLKAKSRIVKSETRGGWHAVYL
ncbi:MAG: hypothetical protein ACPLSA_06140, partial [Caldanaerobacter sp.]